MVSFRKIQSSLFRLLHFRNPDLPDARNPALFKLIGARRLMQLADPLDRQVGEQQLKPGASYRDLMYRERDAEFVVVTLRI